MKQRKNSSICRLRFRKNMEILMKNTTEAKMRFS
uniref:Uncharacterized protein n=1 Tax=Parascaris equorum TaxID=6256 RepID=A0A914R2G1_PAREQ